MRWSGTKSDKFQFIDYFVSLYIDLSIFQSSRNFEILERITFKICEFQQCSFDLVVSSFPSYISKVKKNQQKLGFVAFYQLPTKTNT